MNSSTRSRVSPTGNLQIAVKHRAWRPDRLTAPGGLAFQHRNKGTKTMTEQAIETRRFDTPDQRLDMKEMGGISILQMSDGSTGMHAVF